MDKKALHAVTRARTVLLVSQPFYGTLALQLRLEEITDPSRYGDTMAVDGVHMYYWPEFVLGLTEDELIGVVAHEVSHCSYQHMTRRGHRNMMIWNMAGDYRINFDLEQASFTLPKSKLYDKKYGPDSSEEIYEKIYKDAEKQAKAAGSGDGDGKGGGKGMDPGGCGGVIDAGSAIDKAKKSEIAATWEANVRMAIGVAKAANAGKLPGYLERLVTQLKKPRVNWRDQTRQFLDNSTTKDFSWSRPNRRALGSGLLMPGYISDRMNHAIFVADVSGSVSKEMLISFVSEVGGALDEGAADKLTVIYADDGVKHVDEFVQGDLVQAKIMGGGGTDFTDSFNWIIKNAPDASCVIYLTDLITSGYGEDPGCPVLWATYLPDSLYETYAKKVPFGTPIHVASAMD